MKAQSESNCVSSPIDRYEESLNALWHAVMVYMRGTGMDLIRAVGLESLKDLTPAYAAIDVHFREQETIQQLIREKNQARADAEPFPSDGTLAAKCEDLQKFDTEVEALAAMCLAGSAFFPALASTVALEKDGAGHEAARAIKTIYHLAPIVEHRDKKVELRVEGLWKLVDSFLQDDKQFRGRSRAYLQGALKTESSRRFRGREIEDADRLGLRPKINSLGAPELRRARREINRKSEGHPDEFPGTSDDSALALLISAEDDHERERSIAAFASSLPPDQRQLFDAWREGEPPTEARKRLGLPKSTESALRNRMDRWKQKRGAA